MTLPFAERTALKCLRLLDAESAHHVTILGLRAGFYPRTKQNAHPGLGIRKWGLEFPNPLGVAAGFDKNGEVPGAVLGMGFGFTEIGSVTPRPQTGNPRPRVFRLERQNAVINRFGFNNDGHEAVRNRLTAMSAAGITGINIGANKDATDRVADYVAGIEAFYPLASYFTVNVSSPNTPGLRDLQARAALAELLGGVMAKRDELCAQSGRKPPVLLKISPDVSEAGLADIIEEVQSHKVDGLIVSNTTVDRKGVGTEGAAREAGGLSGHPLFQKSTIALAKARRLAGPELPIIGVGGIDSAEAAWTKIRAGADLLQLYTALVYRGPSLVHEILGGLADRLEQNGLASLSDARDTDLDAWAGQLL